MYEIQHQPELDRFVIQINEQQALVEYRLFDADSADAARAIDFTRTYVPEPLRGKGLAEQLVRTALAWAKAQGYELHASCWYVGKFLR